MNIGEEENEGSEYLGKVQQGMVNFRFLFIKNQRRKVPRPRPRNGDFSEMLLGIPARTSETPLTI